MKRGITVTREYDRLDRPCVVIRKKRGKLSVDEIEEILRYEDFQQWNGHYVLLLNCTEATLGGNGCWDLLDEQPGDMVRLYEVTASEECPVCQSNLPPFSYCPSCGIPWSDSGKSIETLLSSMRQEAARNIRDPKASDASHLAWYWSHIGAIDLARQMGVITEERRQELYDEMRLLKPAYASGTENGDVVQ